MALGAAATVLVYFACAVGAAAGPVAAAHTAQFTVEVPAAAQLWIDDQPTRQGGAVRQFVTPPLPGNGRSAYVLRARWRVGDRDVEQTRLISLRPGERVTVSFLQPEERGVRNLPALPPTGLPTYPAGITTPQGARSAGYARDAESSGHAPGTAYGPMIGYSPPSSGAFPYTSGVTSGIRVAPGTGVYPSTSGVRPGFAGPPGTGVFPSTSGYYPYTTGYRGR